MWPPISIIISSISVSIGLVGLILYFRGKKGKRPSWAYETHGIVARDSTTRNSIQILYEGKPVDQISGTRVLFWNAGRDPIRQEDIAKPFSLRLARGTRILRHQVLQVSREEIAFQTIYQEDEGRVVFDFLFLGHADGAYLEIIHAGPPQLDIEVNGALIEHSKGARFVGKMPRAFTGPRWLSPVFWFLLVLDLIGACYIGYQSGSPNEMDVGVAAVAFALGLVPILLLMTLLSTIYERIRKFPAWLYKAEE